jgi:hypothetical protein
MQSVDTRPSGESGHGRLNSAVRGAFAGFAATLPMTAVMFAVQLVLPRSSQIRPEPRVITDKLLQRANIYQKTSERGRKLAALANHFAYGAACGAVCATVAGARLQSSPSTGLLSGLLIWMGELCGMASGCEDFTATTRSIARSQCSVTRRAFSMGIVAAQCIAA